MSLSQIEDAIRRDPVKCLSLVALAGFLAGGGHRSAIGRSVLALVGRAVVSEMVVSALANMVERPHLESPDAEGI